MSARSEFDRTATGDRDFLRLLKSLVVPRPIAWVSTVAADGTDNLAPHSYYTVASEEPPIVQFTSVGRKDSLRNAEATGEFVVNLAPEPLFEQINETGTDYPSEISEFDAVGIDREPSRLVAPPRVAASPASLECRLHLTLPVGSGASTLVLGEVLHIAIAERALIDGHPEIGRLDPLSRLGRSEWGRLGEIRTIERRPYDPPGDA